MKYSGFVDCGGIVAESSEDQATEALVFLVVGLKHFWKCPFNQQVEWGCTSISH